MQQPQEQEIRQQLDKIFASVKFKDAGRARRFLEFVVVETVAGNGADLKENIVGINVFDRSADYDPRLDSIVRVEAGRLRTKLSDYYQDEGREDQVVIALPKGSYVPEITARELLTQSKPETQSDATASSVMQPIETVSQSSLTSRKLTRRQLMRRGLIAAGVLVLAGVSIKLVVMFIGVATPETRIAVLPFTPYSSDARDQLIATQLTEKVTAEFVRLGTFNVVPSTSARQYEDRRPGVREVAAALQADILLEARTMREGNNVRVEYRLSDGARDRKFWVDDKLAGEDLDELARQLALAASQAVSSRWKG